MALLSKRVQSVKPSATLVVAAKAKELRAAGRDVISLAAGEPDFDTPDHIKEAAIQAINDGFTKYTAVPGIVELREAIAQKFKTDNGLTYGIDQISVSTGGKQALYNIAQATLNKGDEVIIPAPYWVSYPDMVLLAQGVPVCVTTKEKEGFKLSAKTLKKNLTKKTRWVVINSPSNPTGEAYTPEEYKALAEVLKAYPNVGVICDDIYEKLVYDGVEAPTFAQIVPEMQERCVIVNGVSKAYSMTGWRIGYAAGPKEIIKAMNTIQSQSTSGATSIAQKAALAALTGSQECLKPMVEAFTERRNFVVDSLNAIDGLSCRRPPGAFYIYVNIGQLIGKKTPAGDTLGTSIDYCSYLLETQEVAAVPGVAFGLDPYFRISFPTSMENLQKAVDRIRASVEALS
ncbi:MAG: pyridoxal phosphate-dependent aminotransferase [Magnetococcales bacterium]|nr:pyridoxal phosphate-dependent aminotransferase [Magnetococcales bacterium]